MPAAKEKNVSISEKIRRLRLYRGMSQLELADKIDGYPQKICNYEKGRIVPSIHVLPKLADALGVTVDFLVRDDLEVSSQELSDEKVHQLLQQIKTMNIETRRFTYQMLEAIINNYKLKTMVQAEAL